MILLNASPRKNKNTAQMLESAMKGAEEAGAETELVHLYDLDYKGCKSCFACQLKNAKTDSVCAIRDGLRPLLEKAREADVIVIGSPVYFSYPTGETRSFLERLIFPKELTASPFFSRQDAVFTSAWLSIPTSWTPSAVTW